jgi:hypothetical protein
VNRFALRSDAVVPSDENVSRWKPKGMSPRLCC